MFLSCLLKSITICGWILSTDLCLHSKLLIYFRKKAKEKFTATHAHRNSSNRLLPLFCLSKETLYCKMSILWDYSFIKAFHIVFHRIVDFVPHPPKYQFSGNIHSRFRNIFCPLINPILPNVFSNQFLILGLGFCWMICQEPFLFSRKLQRCSAVRCFARYETSPDFPSTWTLVDNGWIPIFGWTFP